MILNLLTKRVKMKIFEQLTKIQQNIAVRHSLCWLVGQIVEGVIDIQLPSTHSQDRLNSIMKERWEKKSPRLATLRILNDRGICQELMKAAIVDAEEVTYDDRGQQIRKETVQ